MLKCVNGKIIPVTDEAFVAEVWTKKRPCANWLVDAEILKEEYIVVEIPVFPKIPNLSA